MSWFRVVFVVGLLVPLGACGFRPLYGGAENIAINQQLAHIQITTIEDRIGQQVHNLLLDRLNPDGRPRKPLYTLNVRTVVNTEEIGLKFTEEATRARLTLRANYFLTEDGSGSIIAEGTVRSVNSYNISESEFARVTSEADAKNRAAREVSDEIKTRLSLYFSQQGT
jgi:LPS-assembly lipoprotein